MFSNRDTGDVGSLEEIFRSHEFGRATDDWRGGGSCDPTSREDVIFAKEFGRPLTAVSLREVDDEAEPRLSSAEDGPGAARENEMEESEQPLQAAPSGGGAGMGEDHPEASSTAPSRRPASRYWTIAFVSAIAALVAAGITAGAGQHPRSNASAQGKHHTVRPDSGSHTSGAGSTGSTAPGGSLAATAGSGGQSSGRGADVGLGSGNEPGGHVTLVGPATFTGTPVSPAAPGNSPGAGNGTTGSSPSSGSTSTAAPVASAVGSSVSAAGSSVTTAANQIESSVPAPASTSAVENTVVNTLDQAVSASTG
jgi:hypothetical protein